MRPVNEATLSLALSVGARLGHIISSTVRPGDEARARHIYILRGSIDCQSFAAKVAKNSNC